MATEYRGQASGEEPPVDPWKHRSRRSGIPNERPTLQQVYRRFQRIHKPDGTPYYLPQANTLLETLGGKVVKRHPAQCCGPPIRTNRKGHNYTCQQIHLCTYCWLRQVHRAGLMAAIGVAGQKHGFKFSTSLPAIRGDPEKVAAAKRRVAEALRRAGFKRVLIWVHTFGENPVEGAKGHLDGLVAGDNPEISFLDPGNDGGLARILAPYNKREDGTNLLPYISWRPLGNLTRRGGVKDAVLAGMYAGRPTFNVRRIWAGMYRADGEWCVRMTNVGRGTKTASCVQDLRVNTKPVPDWHEAQFNTAFLTAESWRYSGLRASTPKNIQLAPRDFQNVLAETGWRRFFRLPGNRRLADRYT